MVSRARNKIAAIISIAVIAATAASLPELDRWRGLSIDILTWLNWTTLGQRHDPAKSAVVVVALDEETYRRKPFAGSPTVTWTSEIGRVLNAVIDGGAAVAGFDVIFPASLEQSEMQLGEETLGHRMRGVDRDFLRSLAANAQKGKVVLGQVQHLHQPIRPFEGQRIAVGQSANIRPLNLHADADGVVRRVPLTFDVDGTTTPSMALELAARTRGQSPAVGADGDIELAGYRVPQSIPNVLTLNFEGGADDIPTYSLADLAHCARIGRDEYFREQFAGRAVLFGALLDVEDRSVTSKRFATAVEGARAPRCALEIEPIEKKVTRDTIAAVYVHATAINNLLRRDALFEPGGVTSWLLYLSLAALCAWLALAPNTVGAFVAIQGVAAAASVGALAAFTRGLALPLINAIFAAFLASILMIGYRFVAADKDTHFLRKSFSLYLAPAVVERMLSARRLPGLGGEKRKVTIYFSDIVGFSQLAEHLPPSDLVTLINHYLSAMVEIIESHGGFVDKYIGDAIVAVFGAPVEDAQHERSAVRTALACEARLAELNREGIPHLQGALLAQRIGLSSGEVLVGNIGSSRRFNYTVMGDAVNLASRLEAANRHYGTAIIASEATVAGAGLGIRWRELDTVRVSGRAKPVRIFEPVATDGVANPELDEAQCAYAAGLACWRTGDFTGAAEAFARAPKFDRPSALFFERARRCSTEAPPANWEPVHALGDK